MNQSRTHAVHADAFQRHFPGRTVGKPVGLENASPHAHHDDTALLETLWTIVAVIVETASIILHLLVVNLDEDGMMVSVSAATSVGKALNPPG
ncbi:hypothetical protein HH212_24305 [Massilia forsythiae]|uniref:Uncharacterized protein n=1 Tax=Massilia forsythiae TaxID=2728020 RepID=A0A7Z2ZUW9_9BURK|nr:hypothetical protein [Massilia forsythiae]QJE02740.1 hypothetical protein HH212_24305 [Massilia forsythiae]